MVSPHNAESEEIAFPTLGAQAPKRVSTGRMQTPRQTRRRRPARASPDSALSTAARFPR